VHRADSDYIPGGPSEHTLRSHSDIQQPAGIFIHSYNSGLAHYHTLAAG